MAVHPHARQRPTDPYPPRRATDCPLNGIEDALPETDLLITGEGRLDSQSFTGKVVGTLHGLAKAHDVDLAVAAGIVEGGIPDDFLAVEMIKSSDVAAQLRDAGRRIAQEYVAQN